MVKLGKASTRQLLFQVAGVVVLFCGASAARGQEEAPRVEVRSGGTKALSPLTVSGVVYDLVSGAPIRAAQVSLKGTRVGTLSDSLGRFLFRAPAAGTAQLEVRQLGLYEGEVAIQIEAGRGTVLQVGVEQQTVPMCGLVVCAGPFGCYAVEAIVRDVLTGLAPKGPVMMHVRGATASDSMAVEAEASATSVHLGAGGALPDHGPYDVEVTAKGYAPWRAKAVKRDVCGRVISNPLRIWLFPEG